MSQKTKPQARCVRKLSEEHKVKWRDAQLIAGPTQLYLFKDGELVPFEAVSEDGTLA